MTEERNYWAPPPRPARPSVLTVLLGSATAVAVFVGLLQVLP